MKSMNMNVFAKLVCEVEGGRVNLTIAQVKEVIHSIRAVVRRAPGVMLPMLIKYFFK